MIRMSRDVKMNKHNIRFETLSCKIFIYSEFDDHQTYSKREDEAAMR